MRPQLFASDRNSSGARNFEVQEDVDPLGMVGRCVHRVWSRSTLPRAALQKGQYRIDRFVRFSNNE
jgi:hypothetical protein